MSDEEQIGSVTAKLTLDGSQFDAQMKQSAENATASGRAREAAAKRAAQAEALAAKFAGDAVSEQTLRTVELYRQQKAAVADLAQANRLAQVGYGGAEAAAKTQAAALQRLTAIKMELAAATRAEAAAETHAVSSRMAASAVVRGLESGNVGIRSVENFLTTIPGVGAALQGIFPIIGAVAFGGIIVEMGQHFFEMEQKATHAKEAIAAAFADMHDKAQINIDDLTIQSDKLQDQIDKLSGHPNNGLQTSLDESRKMADQLLVSLQADRKEMEVLFKEHSVGALASMFTGVAATGAQESELTKDSVDIQAQVRKARSAREDAIEKDGSPAAVAAATAAYNAQVKQIFDARIARYRAERSRLQKEEEDSAQTTIDRGGMVRTERTVNNGGKIANIDGVIDMLRSRSVQEQLQADIAAKEATVGGLTGAKAGAAEANKADEQRLKQMEGALAQEKLLHAMSLKETYDFWDAQRNAFSVGSNAYNQVVEKQVQLAAESAAKAHEAIKQSQAQQLRQRGEDATELPRMLDRNAEEMRRGALRANGEQSQDFLDSNQLAIDQARNAAREQEARINEEAGRTMTHYAAAIALADVHAKEFRTTLQALQAEMDIRNRAQALDPNRENARAAAEAQARVAQAISQRAVQMQTDSVAINGQSSSPLVGASDALRDFIRATDDAASGMRKLTDQALSGFNEVLLKSFTTRTTGGEVHRDFANYGAGLFRSAAGTGLEKLEGGVLRGLGVGGKADGSAGSPFHVIMDNLGGAGGGALSALQSTIGKQNGGGGGFWGFVGKLLNGGSGASGAAASSGADAGDAVGDASSYFGMSELPMFAAGGAIDAGTAAIIGERGPELFVPRSAGTIVPNNQIAMGGGGDTHHWSIDARGSTDPAATAAMVQRAIMAATPHIIRAGAQAQRESRYRVPTSRR